MENYERTLSGETERFIRKMVYLTKSNKYVNIHILDGTKNAPNSYVLHAGNERKNSESIQKVEPKIVEELEKNNNIKKGIYDITESDRRYFSYTVNPLYKTYLKNHLKTTPKQDEVIKEYFTKKAENKGSEVFVKTRNYGDGNNEFVYNVVKRTGDNTYEVIAKTMGEMADGLNKRSMNALYKKCLFVGFTNKGRIVNDIEATHLLYDKLAKKTDEDVIGLKYLNEKGELI